MTETPSNSEYKSARLSGSGRFDKKPLTRGMREAPMLMARRTTSTLTVFQATRYKGEAGFGPFAASGHSGRAGMPGRPDPPTASGDARDVIAASSMTPVLQHAALCHSVACRDRFTGCDQ